MFYSRSIKIEHKNQSALLRDVKNHRPHLSWEGCSDTPITPSLLRVWKFDTRFSRDDM